MQVESPLRVQPLPKPHRPLQERRRDRTNAAGDALRRALDHAAHRADLDVIVVADQYGMLVASSTTELDLTMLAAILPLVGRGKASAQVRRRGEPRELTVRPLGIEDELLFVAALGGRYGDRLREVASTAAAARRILA